MTNSTDPVIRAINNLSEEPIVPPCGVFERVAKSYTPAKFPVKKLLVSTAGIEHMIDCFSHAHQRDLRAAEERHREDVRELVEALKYADKYLDSPHIRALIERHMEGGEE